MTILEMTAKKSDRTLLRVCEGLACQVEEVEADTTNRRFCASYLVKVSSDPGFPAQFTHFATSRRWKVTSVAQCAKIVALYSSTLRCQHLQVPCRRAAEEPHTGQDCWVHWHFVSITIPLLVEGTFALVNPFIAVHLQPATGSTRARTLRASRTT